MTTYMLAESPESGGSNSIPGQQLNGSSSNAASLIGSPRSTPVFNSHHVLKVKFRGLSPKNQNEFFFGKWDPAAGHPMRKAFNPRPISCLVA